MTSAVADTATAFGALVTWFAEKGHERIVYIGGPAGSWQDRQRQAVIRGAAESSGATLTMLGPYPSTFAAGVGTAAAVMAARATAVVPYATSIGLGLMFALRQPRHPRCRRQLGAHDRRRASAWTASPRSTSTAKSSARWPWTSS